MRSVMNQCEFSNGEYTPSSDSVVNDIQVDAERPTLPEGVDASVVSSSPRSPARHTGITWVLVVGVVCGMAFIV